jgi:hypothetical protein
MQGTGHLILVIAFRHSQASSGNSADVNIAAFLLGSSLVLGGFSLGLGPITWLLQSEVFPTLIRGRAMGFSVIMRNLCEFLINFSYVPLLSIIGDEGIFTLFLAMCVTSFIFVYLFVVETKHREPDEILKVFNKNLLRFACCGFGLYSCVSSDMEEGEEEEEEERVRRR